MPRTRIEYILLLFLVTVVPSKAALTVTGCNVQPNREGVANYLEGGTYEAKPCTMTISPAAAVTSSVSSGTTVACNPNCASATTVTFTPPSTVAQVASHYGCPASPSDSIYATPINNLPVHSNSATVMAFLASSMSGNSSVGFSPSLPINLVDNSTPTTTYSFLYSSWANSIRWPLPAHPNMKREGGVYNNIGDMDHFVGYINRDTCEYYETYQDHVDHGCGSVCQSGGGAASAWLYNPLDYDTPSAYGQSITTAGNTPRMQLTWSASDIRNGTIRNPIESVMPLGVILFQNASNGGYVWPATLPSFNTDSSHTDLTKYIGYGYWFRLSSAWVTANIGNYSPIAQNMIRALNQYGTVMVDVSGPASFGASTFLEYDVDAFQDPDVRAAINELLQGAHPLDISNFELIDQSSLRSSETWSTRVKPNNSYSVPANFASLTVNDGLDPAATLYMSVLPIAVGTTHPAFTVIAGEPGKQLDSWVTGTANQAVTWSLVSGTGTVSAAGIYTPASTVSSSGQVDVLRVASVADPNSYTTITSSVVSADVAHPSGLAVNIEGPYCDTASGCTRTYQADLRISQIGYLNYPNYIRTIPDFPSWTGSDATVWGYNWNSSGGQDFLYGPFLLQNGHYKVTYMSSYSCNSSNGRGTFTPVLNKSQGPWMFFANNVIGGRVDIGTLAGSDHGCRAKTTYTIPANVTDGWLTTAMLMQSSAGGASYPVSYPYLNGLVIDPDTNTAAHWELDGQQAKKVATGATLQLRQVDWWTGKSCAGPPFDYTTATTSCTWAVNGPGAVSSTGLYTAPSSQPQTASVTVSVSDGTYSAQYSFYVPGTSYPGYAH